MYLFLMQTENETEIEIYPSVSARLLWELTCSPISQTFMGQVNYSLSGVSKSSIWSVVKSNIYDLILLQYFSHAKIIGFAARLYDLRKAGTPEYTA